jgi:hypothetical protein
MKAKTYQKRNLLWISSLVTAYALMASAHSKFQYSDPSMDRTIHQGSTR